MSSDAEKNGGPNAVGTASPAKVLFKPSALTAVADQVWKQSQANDDVSNSSSLRIGGGIVDPPKLKSDISPQMSAEIDAGAKSSGFLFGQNMCSRVANADESPATEASTSSIPDFADASSGGAATEATPLKQSEPPALSLEESAAAYEAKQQHVELKAVDVHTGEEEEKNVLQFSCKLHQFDPLGNLWLGRGKGLLRLNDLGSLGATEFKCRIIIRCQGSLRVMLNSKIWPQMVVERPKPTALRISAFDGNSTVPVIYLISAGHCELDELEKALNRRKDKLAELGVTSITSGAGFLPPPPATATANTTSQKRKMSESTSSSNDVSSTTEPIDAVNSTKIKRHKKDDSAGGSQSEKNAPRSGEANGAIDKTDGDGVSNNSTNEEEVAVEAAPHE